MRKRKQGGGTKEESVSYLKFESRGLSVCMPEKGLSYLLIKI